MTAGRRHAGYECDECHEPIGPRGFVAVGYGTVYAALCPRHLTIRKAVRLTIEAKR